jgi:hypothetical protein
MISACIWPADATGTNFILEGQGSGVTTQWAEGGGAGSLLLGVGARFRRVPMFRLYFTGQVGLSHLYSNYSRSGADALYQGNDWTFLIGPRFYIAFNKHFRIFFDVMLGGHLSGSDWTVNALESYSASDGGLVFATGAGFQFRLIRMLSLGFKLELVELSNKTENLNLASFLGFPLNSDENQTSQFRWGATLTLHF